MRTYRGILKLGFGLMGMMCFLTVSCLKDNNGKMAVVTTNEVTGITTNSAVSGGEIVYDGGSDILACGVCWGFSPDPIIANYHTDEGSVAGRFASDITGLNPNSTYYVRAYVTNSRGTAYGVSRSFSTLVNPPNNEPTISDVDGNVYATITIGSQVWMAENLRVTHFQNGDPIPDIPIEIALSTITTSATSTIPDLYVPNFAALYGRHYNWFAVNDPRLISPVGWHVATDEEWTVLTTYLGGEAVAGGKLKETGTTYWHAPNMGATNSSGFSARGGTFRSLYPGDVSMPGDEGMWWTATSKDSLEAWERSMGNWEAAVFRVENDKRNGSSVRCVKNKP